MKQLLYLIMLSGIIQAQDLSMNQVNIGASYPISSQGTLERAWNGMYSLSGSYERHLTSRAIIGIGCSYARFQIDKDILDINNQGYFISPYMSVGYTLRPTEFLDLTALLLFGNTWVRLHPKGFNSDHKENGKTIEPALRLKFYDLGSFGINITASYKTIFEPFAENQFAEGNTTTFFTFGLSATYKW